MRTILADVTTRRYLFTAAAQKLPRGAGRSAGWGPGGILRLEDDYTDPELPEAPGWVRLRPELSGICGSDTALAHAKSSMVLSAFYTAEKQILGHEIVAIVDRLGPGVTRVSEGDRVVVDPVLSCVHRGFDPPCRTCQEGHPYVCERFDQPGLSGCGAPTQGFDARLGGGWAQYVTAHESQLYPLGNVPSHRAVLAEPASIGLHSALHWNRNGDRAVVIGPGTIGLLTVAALRMLHPDLDIAVVSPDDFGSGHAVKAGATRTLPAGAAAVEALAESDGGRLLRPRMTKVPILEQGVDVVFDCVGISETIDLGLHLLRPTGTLVLVGGAGKQTVDWALVWNRELRVQGTINSGPEPALGGRTTMSQVVEWLADPQYQVDALVTNTFSLDEWTTAIEIASAGPRAGSLKATLRTNPDIPLVEASAGSNTGVA